MAQRIGAREQIVCAVVGVSRYFGERIGLGENVSNRVISEVFPIPPLPTIIIFISVSSGVTSMREN